MWPDYSTPSGLGISHEALRILLATPVSLGIFLVLLAVALRIWRQP